MQTEYFHGSVYYILGVVPFLPDSPMSRVMVCNITVKKVISNFYDL
jgi:hypothetical protein